MRKEENKKFKKGAASFYIVAFSTLILIILATSFVTVMISEITRTSNDDLAQSAYDSALAGVEEAKLAYYSYQNCVSGESVSGDCSAIVSLMRNPHCDMVQQILGRSSSRVEENTAGNNMEQEYTCVKMYDLLKDYRSTLSSSDMASVVNVKFEDGIEQKIDKVKISWFSNMNNLKIKYSNFSNGVRFPSIVTESASTPPTIYLAMMQTSGEFNLSDFESTVGDRTNRGMVYLVPAGDLENQSRNKNLLANIGGDGDGITYKNAYTGDDAEGRPVNKINKDGFLKSNNKQATNLPYVVYCEDPALQGAEFACSATVEIPKALNGERNKDNFVFVVGLPYTRPTTDFALEFFCGTNDCNPVRDSYAESEISTAAEDPSQAYLDGVQVQVDSTGRANDLYRRVEARLDNARSDFALSILGPLELLDNSRGTALRKQLTVTCEYEPAFGGPTC